MDEEVVGGPAEVNDVAAGNQESTDNTGGSGTGESLNPAWSPLLEKLPSSLHPMVTPELKSWDQKFQEQLQQVHSQYEPYKQLIDNQVPADTLQQAWQLFNLINENPQLVYDQMGQYYGLGGQGQQEQQPNNPNPEEEPGFDFNNPEADISQHPKFQELMQNQQMLAQFLVEQQQQEASKQAEVQIESEISAVKEKYPYLNELQMIQLAMGGNMSITQAAEQLNAQRESWLTESRRPAPQVFSGGGSVPAQQGIDPTKMNSTQTRAAVAAILQAQAEGNS